MSRNKLLALIFVSALLSGCSDYKNPREVTLQTGRLYTDYGGNCILVLNINGGYGAKEMTIEGKCK